MQTDDATFLSWLWDAFKWIGGGIAVLALHLIRKSKANVDRLEKRIDDVDRKVITMPLEVVSRDTFQLHERDVKDALDQLRKEAREREDRIISAVNSMGDKLHSRIDSIFHGGQR